jgi:hypothetical protein
MLRSHRLPYILALASLAVYAAQRQAVAHRRASSRGYCSMGIAPGARDSLTNTLLLGRATTDTVPVSGRVVDSMIVWGRERSMYGQVVRVDSMLGPGADRARRPLRARQSVEVVIVP